MNIDQTRSLAPMQASKWLKVPVLLEVEEMRRLFQALGTLSLVQTSGVSKNGEGKIEISAFIEVYKTYVESLKNGRIPDENFYRPFFSAVLTVTDDALFAVPIDADHYVIRVRRPVVQMQNHRFDYSELDHQYRSMVYGVESVLWGIQFSFPQICQDSKTKEVEQVKVSPEFPNATLFRNLQKWIRENTVATPLVAHDIRTNVPIRLGKECFPWINNHPQLMKKGLKVVDYGNPER